MSEFFVRLTEIEHGKKTTRYGVVAAYDAAHAKEKVHCYYHEVLRGMGISYLLHSVTRLVYDAGDIAWLSKRMVP